jgi:hypothetical protein
LFFTTRYLPPASRITLRSAKSLATVSLENVPTIAVVEVSSSRASNWTFSVFFALEIAIVLLHKEIRGQRSEISKKPASYLPFSDPFPRPVRRCVANPAANVSGSGKTADQSTEPPDP